MKLKSQIKTYIKYFLFTSLIANVSCEDELEIDIKGVPQVEDFYKTPEEAEFAITSAYSPAREMYGRENFGATMANDFVFGDIGTDDIVKGGARESDGTQLVEKELYNLTTSNAAISPIWKISFKGILYSNLVINNVPNIEFEDEERKKEIIGEAHFLRAYYYYDLVNTFGGVPLIDKFLEFGEYNVPRSTREETFAFIEKDLEKAITDLPSRFDKGADYLGHADKGAALGLMMRVSLYQNKMDQVKKYGEDLFALAYELEDFGTIFQPEGEWGKGSIFEINYAKNSSNIGNRLPHMIAPRSKGGIGFAQISDDLRGAYTSDDPRLEASFYEVTGGFGSGWYNRKYSIKPYSNYVKPTVGGKPNNAHNIRVIRLADAYLMYAEAIYDIDAPMAVNYVNRVRTRARGVEPTTVVPDLDTALSGQPLLDAIYHERRVEFAGEGLRYHDLVRTGRAETLLGGLGFVIGTHEVMPIPLDQVTQSQGVLIQNNY